MKNDCKLSIFIDIIMICNFLVSLYIGRVALFTCINALILIWYNNHVVNTLEYYCDHVITAELEKRNTYKEFRLIKLEIIFDIISLIIFISISVIDIYRAINIHKIMFILFIALDYVIILISFTSIYNKLTLICSYIKKLRCFK